MKIQFIIVLREPGDIIRSLKVQFISVKAEPGDIIKSLKVQFISVSGEPGDITRSLKIRFNSIGSTDECNNKFFKAFIHSGFEFLKVIRGTEL